MGNVHAAQAGSFKGYLRSRTREQQLPDGTLILTSPTGHTFTTKPGSVVLFPTLCRPTGTL
jgi:hypothetical protein